MTETQTVRPARLRAPAAMIAVLLFSQWFAAGCGLGESGGKSVFDLSTASEFIGNGDRCRVNVYLFRGLLDQPSSGLNDLANELRSAGMNAIARPYTTWEATLAEIEALSASAVPPKLVFMGHSYGADSAVLLARELGARGIAVELLYLVDSTNPPPIPSNVERCVQVYNPNEFADAAPEMFPGNPVFAAPGNTHTQIVNLRARVDDLGPDAASIDVASGLLVHLTLDSEVSVHRRALDESSAVCALSAASAGR